MIRRLTLPIVAAAALAITTPASAIIKGAPSPKSQDYVVQISIEQGGKYIHLCTGTLVAKNLILTARHCVGEPGADDISITDYPASKLLFFFGVEGSKKVSDKAPVEAKGTKLFTNGKKTMSPDIALVQLDKEMSAADQPIAPIRLEGGAVKGETLNVVGYGVTEKHVYPSIRLERKGVTVATKGPGKSAGSLFDLEAGEFQFGEAACLGDSGGPALSPTTNAVVGIASRVTNGQPRDESLLAQNCVGAEAEDVYTDLTPAKSFIQAAFDEVGAEPWIEGEPSPAEKAQKAAEEEAARTAATSSPSNATKDDGGCALSAPRSSSSASLLAALAVLLAVISRRARRAC